MRQTHFHWRRLTKSKNRLQPWQAHLDRATRFPSLTVCLAEAIAAITMTSGTKSNLEPGALTIDSVAVASRRKILTLAPSGFSMAWRRRWYAACFSTKCSEAGKFQAIVFCRIFALFAHYLLSKRIRNVR